MVRNFILASGYSEAEIEAQLARLGAKKTGVSAESKDAARIAEAAYWERVRNGKSVSVADLPRRPIAETMTAIRTDYAENEWEWDFVKPMVYAIVALGYGDAALCEKLGLSPKKGLIVSGGYGLGKTTAFDMCKKHGALYAEIVSCLTLKKIVLKDGYAGVDKYETRRNVVFDDFGREGATANNYGNRIDAVADIVAARYDLFRAGKIGLTCFTTNLSLSAIAEAYSPHITDRIKEMCNVLILPERKSYRQ